ncbi:hypothetical protein PR048_005398 [Dryococelus australis]|uniref:DUF4371 domain-containing protein n=1 Tax=Dryococelus australis TaxID=614101 RepID=A0ABQ9I821_9NEOP|nr:hypothetical protein PR048_005398 [Dryococelus australis]
MVRFFRANKVETHLYNIVAFGGKTTGENLFNIVNKSFEEDGISWQNCLYMSSDGAKAMVGQFNSVLSRVKGQQENLWFLHCTCHVAHLAASHACNVYTYFKTSGKRQDEFHNIQKSLGVKEHKILWPCSNRWLAILQCVERLLKQWPALTHYFDSLDSKQCILKSVHRIKETLHSPSEKLYFLFLNAVLPRAAMFTSFILKHMFCCISLLQALSSFQSSRKHPTIHVDFKRENKLSDAALFVGHATRTFLERNAISKQEKADIFNSFRKFYEMGTRELYCLLNLQDEVLKSIDILEPTKKESVDWQKEENWLRGFQM